MKTNLFQISLLFLSCAALLCGCANDDEQILSTDGSTLTVYATADGFSSADGVKTRASDDGYKTTFTNGDKIGVFAVKNGAIIADCDNVELTYNGTNWDGKLYYYTGAQYFAYYPYDASMNDKTNVEDIVNAFKPQPDQSDYANYTKSDLMTAEGIPNDKTLSLSFAHKMSLIEISLSVKQNYKTSVDNDAYKYSVSIPVTDEAKFSIGGEEVQPYNMGGGVYRYIVPAGTVSVSGEFQTSGSKTIEYGEESISLQAGSYKRLNVSYTNETAEVHSLAVGDFYYSDGSIYPGGADSNPPKEGCIGIVCCVTGLEDFVSSNSSELAKKLSNGVVHGLVVALKDLKGNDSGRLQWGQNDEVATWLDNNMSTLGFLLPNGFNIRASDKKQGYTNTLVLQKYADSGKDVPPIKDLQPFKDEHPTPLNSSGWYWPSAYELQYVCSGEWGKEGADFKGTLEELFKKVSGTAFTGNSGRFWSSTEYSDLSAWFVDFSSGNVLNYGIKDKGYFRVRPLLAF